MVSPRSLHRAERHIRRSTARLTVLAACTIATIICIRSFLKWRAAAKALSEEPIAQVTNFPANLPVWASLNPASWNGSVMVHDESVDPLPLLNTFNISSVNPTKKTKRLPSGAFGQHGEDIFAYENFFAHQRNGVFLELGALDGYSYSNTLLFEHFMGWRGVLIEAGPNNFARLVQNRPNALCLNLPICNSQRHVSLIEQWGEGGIYDYMAPRHRKRWHKKAIPANLPRVACAPLGFVLERLALKHINFFSLDVEGAELEVLRTVDFTKVSFDVVCLEARGDAEEKDHATRALLEAHGYVFYGRQAHNYFFFSRGFDAHVTRQRQAVAAQRLNATIPRLH